MTSENRENIIIFISYADEDQLFVTRLTADLEDAGTKVLTQKTGIKAGESIIEKIEKIILTCDLFLMILSRHSINNRELKREYGIAYTAQWESDSIPKILPILIENVQLPQFLKDKKLANFTSNYDYGLEELFIALNLEPVKKKRVSLEPREVFVKSEDEKFLKELNAFIEKNISDPEPNFSINALCNKFHLTRNPLIAKIKQLTGEPPNQYIQTYRMKKAAKLFEKKYGNVAEVARAVGYSDPNYFSRLFKKQFDIPPKSFQLSHLKPFPDISAEQATSIHNQSITHSTKKYQVESPIGELELEIAAKFSITPENLNLYCNEAEETPKSSEIFKRIEEFYRLISVLNNTRKYLSDFELIQLLQEAVKEKREELYRSTGYAIEHQDFYEILENPVRKNALATSLICTKTDLLPHDSNYFVLKIKYYGKTFKLHEEEPFHNQPIGAGRMCTGILVDEDVVLTIAHFANEKNIPDLRFIFNFIMTAPNTPNTRIHKNTIYNGVEILQRFHNPEADWVLVKLDRKVEGHEAVTLSKENVFFEQPIYITGHPCGLPLKLASGYHIGDIDTSNNYFISDLSIYSSDDGSPVFSAETHELVGIVSYSRAKDFRWTGDGWKSFFYPHDDLNFFGTRCTRATEIGKYFLS